MQRIGGGGSEGGGVGSSRQGMLSGVGLQAVRLVTIACGTPASADLVVPGKLTGEQQHVPIHGPMTVHQ
jgi:hypothetical protein